MRKGDEAVRRPDRSLCILGRAAGPAWSIDTDTGKPCAHRRAAGAHTATHQDEALAGGANPHPDPRPDAYPVTKPSAASVPVARGLESGWVWCGEHRREQGSLAALEGRG